MSVASCEAGLLRAQIAMLQQAPDLSLLMIIVCSWQFDFTGQLTKPLAEQTMTSCSAAICMVSMLISLQHVAMQI